MNPPRFDPARPFAEHWSAFLRAASARDAPPPPAWTPTAESVAASNLGRFLAARGVASYADLHAWSVRDRAAFWEAAIRTLSIVFDRPPSKIRDGSRWLPGARLNIVESCFPGDPEETALVTGREGAAEPTRLTRGELDRLVHRVARGLDARGFAPGARIALYMPMTLECVAAYLGILRFGGVAVSIADSFPPAELRRRLELSGAAAVVTVDRYVRGGKTIPLYAKVREATSLPAVVAGGDVPDLRAGDVRWETLVGAGDAPVVRPGAPEDLVNILFSSGTTGTPKMIPWTHATPLKCAMDGHFHQDLRRGDVAAWPTNIGWMMGPWLIFAGLINGASLALFEGAPTGRPFAEFVRDAGVTMLGVVPSLVRAWRRDGSVGDGDWAKVRLFSSTGEPSDAEEMLWLMGRTGYRAPVIEYCGGTEIGGAYVTGTVAQPASPATFTTPALGLDMVVLKPDGSAAAEGESGEVYLVEPSIGLSERLLNGDHEAEYFAGCPKGPRGERLRRHGDQLARLPGGFHRALGRVDDAMNLGGIKVAAREIEAVLNQHDAVHETAAIAARGGGGGDRLVVYAVCREGGRREELLPALSRFLSDRLNPLFRIHDLVLVDALPRTASNKILHRVLKERYGAADRPGGEGS